MAVRPKNLFDKIVDRWKEKDSDYVRANHNKELMTTYFRSDEIIDTDNKGQLVGQSIYSGSPSWDARTMSTGFQGSLVSKVIPWLRYQMGMLKLRGVDELDKILQNIKEHMTYSYQRSNFYQTQPHFTLDGVTTGSPVMFGEEDILGERTMWTPQHFKTVRVFYDKWNEPEGVIVEDKTWTAKQIADKFAPNEALRRARLGSSINEALDAELYDEVFTVYRACFKINDPIWDNTSFVRPVGDWKWLTVYFAELTASDGGKKDVPLNDDMGDFVKPFVVWNYDKKPWEASSRTPAFYGLWDNLSLQQVEKNFGENLQYLNRPAMIALDSMGGRLQLGPEGEMLVDQNEYDNPPKPLDRVGGIQFSIELMNMRKEDSARWFMTEFFTKFTNMIETNKQPVSAAQIWQMVGERATMLSPAIETHSTYLEDIDAIMMDTEKRAGRGPFAPDELGNLQDIIESVLGEVPDSVDVSPVFIGPLAQAQKMSQAIEPILTTMEAARPVLELFPEAKHRYRPYKILDHIDEATDFPQDAVVPKEEYDETIAAINAAAAQQQQAEMAIEMAKATPSVSGAVDETSVLAQVGG